MKNHQINESVTINKPGTFNGRSGTIVSLHAKVKLGELGEWMFNFTELEDLHSQVKQVIDKAKVNTVDEFKQIVSDNIEEFKKSTKTPIAKVKSKEQKVKRTYNKKAKP
jgi:hypothetical protein